VASPPAHLTGFGVGPADQHRDRALLSGPYPPGLEPVHDLRGFDHWFLHTYTCRVAPAHCCAGAP
jgi:hypothetical protein